MVPLKLPGHQPHPPPPTVAFKCSNSVVILIPIVGVSTRPRLSLAPSPMAQPSFQHFRLAFLAILAVQILDGQPPTMEVRHGSMDSYPAQRSSQEDTMIVSLTPP